jgi:hypothetical protein
MSERFGFYGYTVQVDSPSADLVDEVRRDFAYFRVPPADRGADVRIEINLDAPPYADLPPARASVITPRNVCFRMGRTTYIDYFGKGLAIFDRAAMRCVVYSKDFDLVHEITYLFILSTVGKNLDSRGLHRLHALAVSYNQKGIALLLPSGGGKSTTALKLLRHPGFQLLSEDTPLVDRRGRLLPFPLRIGIGPGKADEIPPQYLRTRRRMEFDPKTLIDIDYFRDRLGGPAEPSIVLVGERNLGEVSEIAPLAMRHTFKALLKYAVVGLGVYQGLEFLLERGLWEMLGKGGVAGSRLYNSLRLMFKARAYRFVLGRDTKKNFQTLVQFIEKTCG